MSDIVDNTARHRFEMAVEDHIAFVDYRREGDTLVLTHAEVPNALSGRGIGSRLTKAVLDTVRGRGETVVPNCPFIADFIGRNPAYADLVRS